MSMSTEYYREQMAHCERAVRSAIDEAAKLAYFELFEQWQELAVQAALADRDARDGAPAPADLLLQLPRQPSAA